MYHKVFLCGNLGRDPEMSYLPSGTAVTHISLATNEEWPGQNGQKQKRTIWWRVSVFGKMGEAVNQYKRKGDLVMVEGRMQADPQTGGPRLWTGQDGYARSSFEVTASAVKFLSSRGDSAPTSDDEPGSFELDEAAAEAL